MTAVLHALTLVAELRETLAGIPLTVLGPDGRMLDVHDDALHLVETDLRRAHLLTMTTRAATLSRAR